MANQKAPQIFLLKLKPVIDNMKFFSYQAVRGKIFDLEK